MEKMVMNLEFYKNKRVFITGHTGFKGTWLSKILIGLGAEVSGFSLKANTAPNLFEISKIESEMKSIVGDIRNLEHLKKEIENFKPEIVLHLAAQPIVRDSYKDPVYTYETNVMGTVNILEAINNCDSVKSFLNVTTDKVYENKEWPWGYRENEPLNGYDPYSNSKSCSELITSSYKKSFLTEKGIAVSTARAGNVIGGGDFSNDRIIPDCVRAAMKREKIIVRNPHSTRPYQHVLEPLFAYLMIAQRQFSKIEFGGSYNVGPNDHDCVTTGKLVTTFCDLWGENLEWENCFEGGPHEANFLKLDCSKLKMTFNWTPHWNINKALKETIRWTKCYLDKRDISDCMDKQIKEYCEII